VEALAAPAKIACPQTIIIPITSRLLTKILSNLALQKIEKRGKGSLKKQTRGPIANCNSVRSS
jgi:hypothetical protein